MAMRLTDLTAAFHDLRAAVIGSDATTTKIIGKLPLATLESFTSFEDYLKRHKFASAFVSLKSVLLFAKF